MKKLIYILILIPFIVSTQEIIQPELIYDKDNILTWTHKVNAFDKYLSRYMDMKTKIDDLQGNWALYDCITEDVVIYRKFQPDGIKITEVIHSGNQVKYFVDSNLEWEIMGREVHFENKFFTPTITAVYRGTSSSSDTLDVLTSVYRDGDYLVVEFEPGQYPVYVDPTLTIVSLTTRLLTIYTANANYTTSRETTPAVSELTATLRFGNVLIAATNYYVWRHPYTLDLSTISSDTLSLNSARIGVYYSSTSGTPIDSMVVVKATYTGHAAKADMNLFEGYNAGAPHTPTILSDYFDNTVGGWGAGWYYLDFNAAGLDSLKKHFGDSLTVMVISTLDINNVAPTGDNQLQFQGSSGANPPFLELDYDVLVTGDVLTGSRGTIIREAPGNKLTDKTKRKQKVISQARKKG